MGIHLDERGRLTLPKKIREITGLKPGTELELSIEGKSVLIKPKIQKVKKVRSNRFWNEKTFLDAGVATFGDQNS